MEKTAVITGATSAIGAAIAARLANHRRVLVGRSRDRLHAACELRQGDELLEADLADRDQVAELPGLLARLAPTVDVLVHAAGAFYWADAAEADLEPAREVIDVSLTAAVASTHAALPRMGDGGAVIFVGSAASRTAFAHNGAYVAAKHGLAGFAGSVFEDVRNRGIRVSLVCPGFVSAGATLGMGATAEELAGFLSPGDVADAVEFVLGFPSRGCVTEIQLRPQRRSRFE